ncbi:hypothetical protein [Bacteroides sp. 51]|uniref:hypothetical protein n=1 Tax=Bacteroides sp. 51 TaxID=2302938 RepID=UPI0013D86DFF|nr:hypothetical protein [Bacteroides sp. 51]NDV81299.1 hypothetical protein [Bacteroides sp. 51]
MDTGYYKALKNIAQTDNLKEKVLKGEIIDITEIEHEYGGVAITFWRFGKPEPAELFFAKKKKSDLNEFFKKV